MDQMQQSGQVTGAATESTLLAVAGLVTGAYDHIALTYVAAGNGAGEIETATYRTGGSGGTIITTLTLTYDASNRIATVTSA